MVTVRQSAKYLTKHKSRFGFADYDIAIKDRREEGGDRVASTDVNWLERKLTITLYKDYYDRSDWKATLIHELIHALVARYQMEFDQKMAEARYLEEEKVINILTDAMMEFIE